MTDHELIALRAQLATVTHERDGAAEEAAACVEFLRNLSEWHAFWEEGFLGEKTASASRQNGQALRAFLDETGHARRVVERIAALERERDEALAVIRELRQKLAEAGVEGSPPPGETTIARLERLACEARADAARLREALTQVRDAMRATGQEPDGDDDPRRPVASAVWHALVSTPSAELTPRDMRVAEAG